MCSTFLPPFQNCTKLYTRFKNLATPGDSLDIGEANSLEYSMSPSRDSKIAALVSEATKGETLPLARLITMVEKESDEIPQIMKLIQPLLGRAYRVGVTGPPGAGKSTIVDRMTALLRDRGCTVGIIAADPTSPFSGGAVLGDRIRMQQHYLDDGVFIRSMATRGSHGGLPLTTRGAVKLLDAAGKDYILVETVGVGQTELDIMENVDTVIVALVPEAGDAIQTMKAGLMEIADIFAVNKADRPGADSMVAEIQAMLHLQAKQNEWQPPVIATQAINDVGIEELCRHVERHRHYLEKNGRLAQKRRQQRHQEFIQIVESRITRHLLEQAERDTRLADYLTNVEEGRIDPYSAAEDLFATTEP